MGTASEARKITSSPDETPPNNDRSSLSTSPLVMRTATFFFAANLTTGVINYLFQVSASRSLSASDFSQLNAWFADLAVLFFFGGLIQYYGIFFPARRVTLRRTTVAINVLALALVTLWQFTPEGQTFERGVLIFTSTTSLAWLMGQMHYRKHFSTIGIVNLVSSSSKLLLVLVPFAVATTAESFRFAYFICFLPALWVLSTYVLSIRQESAVMRQKRNDLQLWMAPAVMSLAAATIPQMDMVLTSRLFPEALFQEFAHSSLFARGIYFIFLILAQWLLPFQLQGQLGRFKHRLMIPGLAVMAVLSAAAIAAVSPWVAMSVLGWEKAPPVSLVFMACLNMNLLTGIFLLVQKNCAEGNARRAGLALGVLALEAIVQFAFPSTSSEGYFALASLFQVGVIWFLAKGPTQPALVRQVI